jgi:hypothetical protein
VYLQQRDCVNDRKPFRGRPRDLPTSDVIDVERHATTALPQHTHVTSGETHANTSNIIWFANGQAYNQLRWTETKSGKSGVYERVFVVAWRTSWKKCETARVQETSGQVKGVS